MDVPIQAGDGIILRADVFRPSASGGYPVILSCGPYGKGQPFRRLMPPARDKMTADYPDILQGSSGQYLNFEVVDPEKWVAEGYVCVRVDSRGTGRSPGYLDPFTQRETRDLYECIGGILSTFADRWYSLIPQYGMGESGGRNPHTDQLVCGDETFPEEELSPPMSTAAPSPCTPAPTTPPTCCSPSSGHAKSPGCSG